MSTVEDLSAIAARNLAAAGANGGTGRLVPQPPVQDEPETAEQAPDEGGG